MNSHVHHYQDPVSVVEPTLQMRKPRHRGGMRSHSWETAQSMFNQKISPDSKTSVLFMTPFFKNSERLVRTTCTLRVPVSLKFFNLEFLSLHIGVESISHAGLQGLQSWEGKVLLQRPRSIMNLRSPALTVKCNRSVEGTLLRSCEELLIMPQFELKFHFHSFKGTDNLKTWMRKCCQIETQLRPELTNRWVICNWNMNCW